MQPVWLHNLIRNIYQSSLDLTIRFDPTPAVQSPALASIWTSDVWTQSWTGRETLSTNLRILRKDLPLQLRLYITTELFDPDPDPDPNRIEIEMSNSFSENRTTCIGGQGEAKSLIEIKGGMLNNNSILYIYVY